jgi:hypothetical protein
MQSKLYKAHILNHLNIQHDPNCKQSRHCIHLYKCIPAYGRLTPPIQYSLSTPHGVINTDNILISYHFDNQPTTYYNKMSNLKTVDHLHCKIIDPEIVFDSNELNMYVYDYLNRGYFLYFNTDCELVNF